MTHRRRLGVLAIVLAALVGTAAPALAMPPGRDAPVTDPVRPYGDGASGVQVRDVSPRMLAAQDAAVRPGQLPARLCGQDVCVHYVTSGANASTETWARTTLRTFEHVYSDYQAAGYRMPEPDGTEGGDARTDVYLQDLQSNGFANYYGYCTSAPSSDPKGKHDTSAYCVLDNDYSPAQYGRAETPRENLEVTAAHEFFHAVQYGYDADEDTWFAEATATWAEDQVYNGINDNRQYLPYGPMGKPRQSMDLGTYDEEGYQNFGVYGDWLFFRFLSEQFPAAPKGSVLPTIVRQIWEAADSTGATNRYSVQAIEAVLKEHGTTLQQEWGRFIAANRHPRVSYREGAAYRPAAPDGTATLGAHATTASGSFSVDHLAAATERLRPRHLVRGSRLRVVVTTARPGISDATVSVWHADGTVSSTPIRLTTRQGRVTVRFASASVSRVELTLGNAGAVYRCGRGTEYACQGTPLRDNLRLAWTAKVLKP